MITSVNLLKLGARDPLGYDLTFSSLVAFLSVGINIEKGRKVYIFELDLHLTQYDLGADQATC